MQSPRALAIWNLNFERDRIKQSKLTWFLKVDLYAGTRVTRHLYSVIFRLSEITNTSLEAENIAFFQAAAADAAKGRTGFQREIID